MENSSEINKTTLEKQFKRLEKYLAWLSIGIATTAVATLALASSVLINK